MTCRPWEQSALSPPPAPVMPTTPLPPVPAATPPGGTVAPPAGGSVLVYNRVVSIFRMAGEGSIGPDPYSGFDPSTALVLFTNVAASITLLSAGRSGKSPLPTDISTRPGWTIVLPLAGGVPQYGVRDRDILIDDEQYRYGVGAAVWSVFGYSLACTRLEV